MPTLSHSLRQAVLARLGVTDPGAPSLELLDRLAAAYTRAIPWESVSRIARRHAVTGPAAWPRWPETFWREALDHGTGGTCFESNYALFSLLRDLGFEGYLTINDMEDTVGCHTAIVIRLENARWLVDAGMSIDVALPLGQSPASRDGALHRYTATPVGAHRYDITRTLHPQPYCYTLVDGPVDDATYRAATAADYGDGGWFLDRIIVNKIVGNTLWRFNMAESPDHLLGFRAGARVAVPVHGDIARGVSSHFQINEDVVRQAIAALGGAWRPEPDADGALNAPGESG